MFCRKCGKEIEDGMKFCPGCGADLGNSENAVGKEAAENAGASNDEDNVSKIPAESEPIAVKKKISPLPFVIIGIVTVVLLAVIITGIVVMTSPARKYDKQLSLGQRYLDELDYEQAIAAYRAAIDIDPKNPEAYKALAEIYIEMNDIEKAIAILDEGINATGDDELKKMLDDLKNRSEVPDSAAEEPRTELDEANEYLDAQDYDTALQMYLAMLDEDPMNVEAYLGIVEVYLRMGEYDKALEYAQKGYDLTGDERLLEKINMINSGNISDSRGRALKMTWTEDGEVKWWHEYTYDANGRDKSITVYDSNGNQVDYGEYEYDNDGNCIVNVGGYRCDDGTLIKYLYYYDENGRIIRNENGPNSDFWIEEVTEYLYHGNEPEEYRRNITRYDESGNETQRQYELISDDKKEVYYIESDGSEWLSVTHEWEYDDNGNVLRYTYTDYDQEGNMTYQDVTVYEYDEDGNMTRDVTYDMDGNVMHERNYQ